MTSIKRQVCCTQEIPPIREAVRPYHEELLDLFRREMDYRRNDDLGTTVPEDDDYIHHFEQLYWCGFLLYLIGNPADVPLMWEEKYISMDTGCGFDGQFLVGAGVEETIRYLEENHKSEIAGYLRELGSGGEFAYLSLWERYRIYYF